MDHEYALSVLRTDIDVVITPPPNPLHHCFVSPPSDSPQTAGPSAANTRNESAKQVRAKQATEMATNQDQLEQAKEMATKQDQLEQAKEMATNQDELEATKRCVSTRNVSAKRVQAKQAKELAIMQDQLEQATEMATRQLKTLQTKRLATCQDQSMKTANSVKDHHLPEMSGMTTRQGQHARTKKTITKQDQSHSLRKMTTRQERLSDTKKTVARSSPDTKTDTTKDQLHFHHKLRKGRNVPETRKADAKRDHQAETGERAASRDDNPEAEISNGKDGEPLVATAVSQSSSKGKKKGRKPSQTKPACTESQQKESDEALIPSASNSTKGMRSVLAEHLLSAISLKTVSHPVLECVGDDRDFDTNSESQSDRLEDWGDSDADGESSSSHVSTRKGMNMDVDLDESESHSISEIAQSPSQSDNSTLNRHLERKSVSASEDETLSVGKIGQEPGTEEHEIDSERIVSVSASDHCEASTVSKVMGRSEDELSQPVPDHSSADTGDLVLHKCASDLVPDSSNIGNDTSNHELEGTLKSVDSPTKEKDCSNATAQPVVTDSAETPKYPNLAISEPVDTGISDDRMGIVSVENEHCAERSSGPVVKVDTQPTDVESMDCAKSQEIAAKVDTQSTDVESMDCAELKEIAAKVDTQPTNVESMDCAESEEMDSLEVKSEANKSIVCTSTDGHTESMADNSTDSHKENSTDSHKENIAGRGTDSHKESIAGGDMDSCKDSIADNGVDSNKDGIADHDTDSHIDSIAGRDTDGHKKSVTGSGMDSCTESIAGSAVGSNKESIPDGVTDSCKEIIAGKDTASRKASVAGHDTANRKESIFGSRTDSHKASITGSITDSHKASITGSITDSHKASITGSITDSHKASITGSITDSHKASISGSNTDSHKASITGSITDSHKASISGSNTDSHKASISGSITDSHKASISGSNTDSHKASIIGSSADCQSIEMPKIITSSGEEGFSYGDDSAMVTLRNICEAVKLQKKTVSPPSNSSPATARRKRTAQKAGLDDSQHSSDCPTSSQTSDVSVDWSVASPGSSIFSSPGLESNKNTRSIKKPRFAKAEPIDLPLDIDKYRIPLREYGWKRELVVRGIYDEVKCKLPPADVYYFAPCGRKLRSRVMVATFLLENPCPPLTVDNFTFVKKSIWEEPWETVRQAGRNGRSKVDGGHVLSPSPAKKAKVKVGAGVAKKATADPVVVKKAMPSASKSQSPPSKSQSSASKSQSPPSKSQSSASKSQSSASKSQSSSRAVSNSHKPSQKSSNVGRETDTDDEDYDPLNENQTPNWKKSRCFSSRNKTTKQMKREPEREILIQCIPEPDIIIDTADESLYSGRSVGNKDSVMDVDVEESASTRSEGDVEPSPARMMLLPEDIKEECEDADESREGSKKKNSEMGTVHIHKSKDKAIRLRSKPTARKSTMPRIALKEPSSASSKTPKVLDLDMGGEGQLCTSMCPGRWGQAPSLQCRVCMCLFHHECVNLNPDYSLSVGFKCLRCKDKQIPQTDDWPSDKIPRITPSLVTTTTTTTASSVAPPPRVFFVRTPMVSPAVSTQALTHPLLVTTPLSQATCQAGKTATDGLQILAPGATHVPFFPSPLEVKRAPLAPPQLVRGGAPPMSAKIRSMPALQARPPPRLTAAPGVVVTSPAQPPIPAAVVPQASPVMPPMCLAGGVQPQTQMLTLPSSLLGRINLSQPLTIRLNNSHVVVPASCLLSTQDGLKSPFSSVKVLLPPSTFPIHPNTNAKLPNSVSDNVFTTSTEQATTTTIQPTATTTTTTVTSIQPATSSSTQTTSSSSSSSTGNQARMTSPVYVNASPNDEASGRNASSPPVLSPSSQDELLTSSKEDGGRVRQRRCANKRSCGRSSHTIHMLHGGFDCMLVIFRYLRIPDLLRAGQVCRTWQRIACTPCLALMFSKKGGTWPSTAPEVPGQWHKFSLKGIRITDWSKATDFLTSVKPRVLNLRKLPSESEVGGDIEKFWSHLTDLVSSLTEVLHVEFGVVTASLLHSIADMLSKLQVLRADLITNVPGLQMWRTLTKLDVGKLKNLTQLQELRLRGVAALSLPSFSFSGSLSELANLRQLHTLSLTSLHALRDCDFTFLASMHQLRVLELGDCLCWTQKTYKMIGELTNLRHLRLEWGGDLVDCGLRHALAKLTQLERLELILFTIPASLEFTLHQLPQLRTLVVWPNSCREILSAVVNSHALTAVVGLQQLSSLEWGVVSKRSSQKSASATTIIPLLVPGSTLDPEVERSEDSVMEVSINDFTQRLLHSLPKTTTIKVFDTPVLGMNCPSV